jgi:hypothetical protein
MKNNQPIQSSLDLELRESQNFFRSKEVQLSFLRKTFLLYTLTFFPAVFIAVIIDVEVKDGIYAKAKTVYLIIAGAVALGTGCALGFSKILSRMKPLSFLIYGLFIASLTSIGAAASVKYKEHHPELQFFMLFANGLGLTAYSIFANNNFSPKNGFYTGLFLQFICLVSFSFYFFKIILSVMAYSLVSLIVLVTVAFGSFGLVQNRNFDLLPSDYIFGCMKMITILPLIKEAVAEDEDDLEEAEPVEN